MKKHRFFYSETCSIGQLLLLNSNNSHKIIHVLKLTTGQTVYLFNNTGFEYKAIIKNISRNKIQVLIQEQSKINLESPLKIHLGQAICKAKKMDLIIQKSIELGVAEITPLMTERTIVKSKFKSKLEHWQLVAESASCQSGRTFVPKINQPIDLQSWAKSEIKRNNIILDPKSNTNIKNLNFISVTNSANLLIGPEGGFSGTELEYLENLHFIAVSMGPRVLRAETAGLTAIAILQAKFGDL